MNHNSNKRDLQEEKVEDFSFSHFKRPSLEDVNKEQVDTRNFFPLKILRTQELYGPEEDLEDQFKWEGIPGCQKRLLYLRKLDTISYNYCRNETYHKLRALKKGFLNGFENLVAGYSHPFKEIPK